MITNGSWFHTFFPKYKLEGRFTLCQQIQSSRLGSHFSWFQIPRHGSLRIAEIQMYVYGSHFPRWFTNPDYGSHQLDEVQNNGMVHKKFMRFKIDGSVHKKDTRYKQGRRFTNEARDSKIWAGSHFAIDVLKNLSVHTLAVGFYNMLMVHMWLMITNVSPGSRIKFTAPNEQSKQEALHEGSFFRNAFRQLDTLKFPGHYHS